MISEKKIELEKKRIIKNCKKCNGISCSICMRYCVYIDDMAKAEIPVDYWFRNMKLFYGDDLLKKEFFLYEKNIDDKYLEGRVLCLSGHRGVGKSLTACSILKSAILKGYFSHYVTLVELVNDLMSSSSNMYRKLLKKWDFLVIDEVDQRYFDTINSKNLYGNHFENILRIRTQNKLPLIICTNSEDIDAIFAGEFQESFKSLKSQFFDVIPVIGHDAREKEGKI